MDLAAALGAASAAALNLVGYNRTNFFQNLSLQQSRLFRRQHIVTAQANLFRNDVQQAIGASVTVQERLSVVSTLLLAVSTHSLSFRLPARSADFLEGLYYLSISTSFLSFMLALHCSVSASILARRSEKELLNCFVRPPFEEMIAAVDESAQTRNAENFEHSGLANVFRVPGSAALRQQFDEDLAELRRRGRFSEKEGTEGSLDSVLLRQVRNDRTLQNLQTLWDDLAAYTPYFLLWGMRSLLSSFSFYALSQYFAREQNCGYVVHFFYMVLVIGMSALSENLMPTGRTLAFGERLLLIIDHGACFIATWHARWDAQTWAKLEGISGWSGICITVSYLAQCGVSMCLLYRFVSNTDGGSVLETLLETNDLDDESCSETESSSSDIVRGLSRQVTATNELCREQFRRRDGIRTVCMFSGATIVLAWMGSAICNALFTSSLIQPPFQFHRETQRLLQSIPSPPPFGAPPPPPKPPPSRLVDVSLGTAAARRTVRVPGSRTLGELLTLQGMGGKASFLSSPTRLVARDATGAVVGEEVPLGALAKPANSSDALVELNLAMESS